MDDLLTFGPRAASRALASIRRSLDFPMASRSFVEENKDAIKDLYLEFESARYSYDRLNRANRINSSKAIRSAVEELKDDLGLILSDDDHLRLLSNFRFRILPSHREEESSILARFKAEDMNTLEATAALFNLADDIISATSAQASLQLNPVAQLREILPLQSLAPLKFAIRDAKIVVLHQKAEQRTEDQSNILSAKNHLIDEGEKILEELGSSNCDRRLLETYAELQQSLVDGQDIIALGLKNLACGVISKKFCDELPDVVFARMQAQANNIGMFVAQFPDWQRFSDAAAEVTLESTDIVNIASAAKSIAQSTASIPELVDPEVPRLISGLEQLLADPQKSMKRVGFALLRSLENFFIKTFQFVAELVDDTLTETKKTLSKTISKAAVGALVAAAIASATPLSDVAAQVSGSQWLHQAIEIVKSQVQKMAE